MTDPQDTGFDAIEHNYRDQVIVHYNRLALTGLPERDPGLHGVPLDKVFVKLDMESRQSGALDPATQRERARLEAELAGLEERGQRTDRRRIEDLQYQIERLEAEARKPKLETRSVAKALHKHKRLTIVGGPGSGKTTLTRWLALTFAQNRQAEPDRLGVDFAQPRLPILLELRRFADHLYHPDKHPVPDLAEEIPTYIGDHAYYSGTTAEFIAEALADGRCILLVDGLDEIAELARRRTVMEALNALLRRADRAYRNNLCIVTSRPHGYRDVDLGVGFQTGQVKPFTPEDVRLFVEHWYETAYGTDAQDEANTLNTAIDANERVGELATNPLLCTIIAIVYRNNRVLPNRRVELYLKCCEAMLDTWERNKDIRESSLIGQYDWQTKLALLAPLAYWLHSETERLSAPEDKFVEQLAGVLVDKRLEDPAKAEQEARRFLAAIHDRSGLLQGRGDGSLEFAHRTFQEYLAARHIAAQPDPDYIDMVMSRLHEAWWREVHLLVIGYLGSGNEGADKASALLLQTLGYSKSPLWFLRSRPFSVWRLLPWLVARLLSRWQLERRLSWALAREFELACEGYGDCTPLGVTPEAAQAIRDEAEFLLLQIVQDPGRHEKKHNVRQIAATSLDQLGQIDPELVPALIHVLDDNDELTWSIRQAAALSLGQLGQANPETTSALVYALNDNDDLAWSIRQAAALSLGQLGQVSPEVVTTLMRALNDRAWSVRQAAVSSLGQLRQISPKVVSVLISQLDDSVGDVRTAAASSLGQLGKASPEVTSALIRVLNDDESSVRQAAASGFGMLGKASPEVISALTCSLADTNEKVRKAAITSLGQLEQANPEIISALILALNDNEESVRKASAFSLIQMEKTSTEVALVLIHTLDDNKASVRKAAVVSLGQLKKASPEVVAALIRTLNDDEWTVRQAATSSLVQLRQTSPDVISALVRVLDDISSGRMRQAAASSLVQMGNSSPEIVSTLIHALEDRDYLVALAATYDLGRLGQAQPEVVSALIRTHDDNFGFLREAAASSLGQLRVENETMLHSILAALNRQMHDIHSDVRRAALESIRNLLNGRPIPGYGWRSLRKRQERRRKFRRWTYWVSLICGIAAAALVTTWLLGFVDPNSFLGQFLYSLTVMAAVGAALAQILGWQLRGPGE